MLHYEEHRQHCHDRLQRFRAEAVAREARRSHRQRRRLGLAAGLELLLRARRHAARGDASA